MYMILNCMITEKPKCHATWVVVMKEKNKFSSFIPANNDVEGRS